MQYENLINIFIIGFVMKHLSACILQTSLHWVPLLRIRYNNLYLLSIFQLTFLQLTHLRLRALVGHTNTLTPMHTCDLWQTKRCIILLLVCAAALCRFYAVICGLWATN